MWATGRRSESGFTLLELLVVLALIALLAAALPVALRQLMPGQHLKVAAAGVATQLRELQSKAALTGRKQEFRVDQGADIPSGIGVALTAAGDARLKVAAIEFFPDGSTSGGRITLTAGERRRELEVSALTGRIRMVRQ